MSASVIICILLSPGFDGQSKLITVATHSPRMDGGLNSDALAMLPENINIQIITILKHRNFLKILPSFG
jgi:hypothetical protein